MSRAGSEMPPGQSPYSSSQKRSKTKSTGGGKHEEWRDELKRAPRGLPHPSASSGKRGCVWLLQRDFQAQVRSMRALNADQSLTTPLGVGISE